MAGNFDRKLRILRINFRVLLHAANMRHGAKGFTSLPKEGVLRIFFASAGFEPANLGTKGQHAATRPPKPLIFLPSLNLGVRYRFHNNPPLVLVLNQMIPAHNLALSLKINFNIILATTYTLFS